MILSIIDDDSYDLLFLYSCLLRTLLVFAENHIHQHSVAILPALEGSSFRLT